MSDENRPEAGDSQAEPRGSSAFTALPDEFKELSKALLRLQEERYDGLLTAAVALIHAIRTGEKQDDLNVGLGTYIQAQNDIERLLFLMVFQRDLPPTIVSYTGPSTDLAELVHRMRAGEGIVVPPGTEVRRMTALEALGQIDTEVNPGPPDHPYQDSANHPLMPRLDGLVTTVEGPFDVGGHPMSLTFIEMGANKIPASKVSAIGGTVARNDGQWRECIFIRFKGGDLYRYWPFRERSPFIWTQMVTICRQMQQAIAVALTVGEYVERVLKTAHDQGLVICEKLEGMKWVPAMNREELAAHRQAHPPKRKGKGELRPEHISLSGEPYPESIRRGGPDGVTDADLKEDRDNALGRGRKHPDF